MTTETMMIDATETDDDVMCFCDACQIELTDAEVDEYGGETCEACYAANHFHCAACDEDCETDDQSTNPALCVSCLEAKEEEEAEERLDAAKTEAQELLDAIVDGGGLDELKAAIKALKRIAG